MVKVTLKQLNERVNKLEEQNTIKIGPINVGEKYFESGHWETKTKLDWDNIIALGGLGLLISLGQLTAIVKYRPEWIFVLNVLFIVLIVFLWDKYFRIEKRVWVPDGYIQKGIIGPVEETRTFSIGDEP